MNEKNFFSKKLKELREEKGLTRSAFATDLGISRGSLSFYENGERIPDIVILSKIAKYFNVSTDYLLGLSDNTSNDKVLLNINQELGLNENVVKLLRTYKQYTRQSDLINDSDSYDMEGLFCGIDGVIENAKGFFKILNTFLGDPDNLNTMVLMDNFRRLTLTRIDERKNVLMEMDEIAKEDIPFTELVKKINHVAKHFEYSGCNYIFETPLSTSAHWNTFFSDYTTSLIDEDTKLEKEINIKYMKIINSKQEEELSKKQKKTKEEKKCQQ